MTVLNGYFLPQKLTLFQRFTVFPKNSQAPLVSDADYLQCFITSSINPSQATIKISTNATAAEFICKNIFPTPVQVKKIIKNKIGDIQQIYLYQNVCK